MPLNTSKKTESGKELPASSGKGESAYLGGLRRRKNFLKMLGGEDSAVKRRGFLRSLFIRQEGGRLWALGDLFLS